MVLVGLGFLVFWLFLTVVTTLTVVKAALITALIFIILGLIIGERPWTAWQNHP